MERLEGLAPAAVAALSRPHHGIDIVIKAFQLTLPCLSLPMPPTSEAKEFGRWPDVRAGAYAGGALRAEAARRSTSASAIAGFARRRWAPPSTHACCSASTT